MERTSERRARVTCTFRGRLGNQMYTVATTLAHAWDHDLRPVFGRFARHYVTNPDHAGLNLVVRQFPRLPSRPLAVLRPNAYVIRDPQRDVPPSALRHVPGQDRILDGLFSREYLYSHRRDQLRDVFAPTKRTERRLMSTYGDLLHGHTVSLNIRRGDFLKQKVLRHLGEELEYYRAALDLIPDVDRVLVLSDDPEWCKANAMFTANTVVVGAEEPYDHLFLPRWVTHSIVANSSFSWWGAWLAPSEGRVVVAPKYWHQRDLPTDGPPTYEVKSMSKTLDLPLHTDSWIRI